MAKQDIIELHNQWSHVKNKWVKIGKILKISPDAARMRYKRVIAKLHDFSGLDTSACEDPKCYTIKISKTSRFDIMNFLKAIFGVNK